MYLYTKDEKKKTAPDVSMQKEVSITKETKAIDPTPTYSIDDEDSIWLVVNRKRPINLDYVPDNLRKVKVSGKSGKSDSELSLRDVAASAVENLVMNASKQNIMLILGSGYRDSELQSYYYNNYVSAYGQTEADKFSARPGTSEHQTGLAADLSAASLNCYLEICFSNTSEGIWLKDHAHEYGFVIRYPKGKETVTGYQFEPWHVRYVGKDLATKLYDNKETLEEHFNLVEL